jgi:hypothetical protein
MARRSKISPQNLAALKATITAYATELELRGFSRRQIAMGMFGKALELLVDELGPNEAMSEFASLYPCGRNAPRCRFGTTLEAASEAMHNLSLLA